MSEDLDLEQLENPSPVAPSSGVVGAAVLMMSVSLLSAIAGLVRAMALTWHYGLTEDLNAYFQAFRIPDFVYFLVAGGAMRTGFVPVFAAYLARRQAAQAWRTFRATLWFMAVVGALVVALGMVFAGPLTVLIAPGWRQEAPRLFSLTTYLMRVMFPAELFMLVGGLLMGTLNAQKHFLWPGVGPIFYNVVIIVAAVVAPLLWGLPTVAYAVPVSALLCNVLMQIPPLARRGAQWRFLLDLRDEGFKQVFRLALPIIFGLAIAEINLLVTAALATSVDPLNGAVAMEFANRLWKFPTRIIGAGIAIAIFPHLAEHYALGNREGFRRDFSFGMRSTLFLTLPPALAMLTLADPLNRLLFHTSEARYLVSAQALGWYGLGIVPLSAVYILARAFYARHDTVTPVWVGITSVAVCVGFALWLGRPMGVGGLALATSLANLTNAGLLAVVLQRRVGGLDGGRILSSLLRQIVPCAAFAGLCWGGLRLSYAYLGTAGVLAKLVAVFGPLSVATVGFLLLAWLFRVEELTSARNLLLRRFRRRSSAA